MMKSAMQIFLEMQQLQTKEECIEYLKNMERAPKEDDEDEADI